MAVLPTHTVVLVARIAEHVEDLPLSGCLADSMTGDEHNVTRGNSPINCPGHTYLRN
jgi:hypothetical protein